MFLLLVLSLAWGIDVISIVRTDHLPPSSNSFVIHDATQALVVDAGRTEADFQDVVNAVAGLSNVSLRGLFLSHGHPDHATAAWRWAKTFSAPIFETSWSR
jgi:glyoxylase-like metal-dependent hydrolase (beta-lactamase superfamily II)